VGALTARVVLIGEAPGREEDERGEPFVARSGRVLNQLLDEIGLRRDDVYITNVVKCRPVEGVPPGRNRAPTKAEIEACAPWLDAQLRMLSPEVIVTLGQIALSRILPGRRLSEVHGKTMRDGARTVLPLYHPAMARYGPKWVELLRLDFRRLVPILKRQERSARTPNRSSRKK
jgi:DNA polymerase